MCACLGRGDGAPAAELVSQTVFQKRLCEQSEVRHTLCALSKVVPRCRPVTGGRMAREAFKKVSAVAFSSDGRTAFFADKFGDVLAAAAPDPGPEAGQPPAGGGAASAPAPVLAAPAESGHSPAAPAASPHPEPPLAQNGAAAAQPSAAEPATGERVKPALLLGHFCSTVTALAVAQSARRLASADRDGKVRVSVLPRAPLLVRLPAVAAGSLLVL